jgi:hypothetical protein
MKKQMCAKKLTLIAPLVAVAILISGCGQQAYSVTGSQNQMSAPGTFTVPPKVDILVAEDNMGSTDSDVVQAGLQSQMQGFLSNLQSMGWDYHFAVAPLVNAQSFTQVTASDYDPNWGSAWVAPFPGASQSSIEAVNSDVFVMPGNFSDWISPGGTLGSIEPGFSTLLTTLTNEAPGTGFIRPDALLVVIALSNGEDTSSVNYCTSSGAPYYTSNQSGSPYLCGSSIAGGQPRCSETSAGFSPTGDGTNSGQSCDSMLDSEEYYRQQLINLKGSASLVQFDAVVATDNDVGASCISSGAWVGSRYEWMASNLGGQTFSICSSQASNILSSLASSLQSVMLGYETQYLFIAQAANPSTIVVTKYPNGDTSNPQVISQDPNNGWEYEGYVSNVYTINYPVNMDLASGYAIKLNGSAELVGNDTASVTFTAAGLQNSSN